VIIIIIIIIIISFWGIELAFQRVPGVIKTEVGYTQGLSSNPTYEEVCSGSSGHAEAVQITYDSTAIKYEDLVTVFWDIHDPLTKNRQGNDVGTQYRTGIYYH
jgi:peptide-methionine (S)-S-oxide reductase